MATGSTPELPDLFRFEDGRRVVSHDDWRRRRAELLDLILEIEYGRLPPAPERVSAEQLHTHESRRFGARATSSTGLSIDSDPPFSMLLDLLVPAGPGPFPVIVVGDACWRGVPDGIALEVLRRGYILAEFNRVEIVPTTAAPSGSRDSTGSTRRETSERWPPGRGATTAAWISCRTLPCADASRIAATGHSRGGKTALLAAHG